MNSFRKWFENFNPITVVKRPKSNDPRKQAMQLIVMSKNFVPSKTRPYPGAWTSYDHEDGEPVGDAHDMAAVVASAIYNKPIKKLAHFNIQQMNIPVIDELIKIGLNYGVRLVSIEKMYHHTGVATAGDYLFGKEEDIEKALQSKDDVSLGLALGYGQDLVDDFVKRSGNKIFDIRRN